MTKELHDNVNKRNQLALKILENLKLYQPILDFHQISVDKTRYNYENQKLVLLAKTRWYKLKEHAAKALTNREKMPKSLEEKQLLNIAKRYHKANRKAGRAWSNILNAEKKGKTIPSFMIRKNAAESLTAKRNFLAHQYIEQKEKIEICSKKYPKNSVKLLPK